MSLRPLRLLAVHAHPDDEASTTGGIFAKYASEGIETILVTCTNGELGDAPDGTKPDGDGHDTAAVVAHRLDELKQSCAILGITHLELLGYHDSGMEGWADNERPDSFWQAPIDVAAARLVSLFETYDPDVVVTYDEYGFYGHPDHIQANRITLRAFELDSRPRKLYYTAIAKSRLADFARIMAESGVERPEMDEEPDPNFGTDDELIGAVIDCSTFATTKRAALAAHGSQTDSSFFLKMPEELFASFFGHESFVRVIDPTGQEGIESDLFAGYR